MKEKRTRANLEPRLKGVYRGCVKSEINRASLEHLTGCACGCIVLVVLFQAAALSCIFAGEDKKNGFMLNASFWETISWMKSYEVI